MRVWQISIPHQQSINRMQHKGARCSCSLHAQHTISLTPGRPLRHKQLPSRITAPAATQDSKERGSPSPQQEERKQPSPRSSSYSPVWVQQVQSKWEGLDTPQKAYAVVVGLAALAVTPRLLTLAVLGVERVIIGGLLVVEEALLELLFRGGALVSVLVLGGAVWTVPGSHVRCHPVMMRAVWGSRAALLACPDYPLLLLYTLLQVGAVGVVGLVLAGIYLFLVPKATK